MNCNSENAVLCYDPLESRVGGAGHYPKSVDESKTILHRLYAVVADYISAFVK